MKVIIYNESYNKIIVSGAIFKNGIMVKGYNNEEVSQQEADEISALEKNNINNGFCGVIVNKRINPQPISYIISDNDIEEKIKSLFADIQGEIKERKKRRTKAEMEKNKDMKNLEDLFQDN